MDHCEFDAGEYWNQLAGYDNISWNENLLDHQKGD